MRAELAALERSVHDLEALALAFQNAGGRREELLDLAPGPLHVVLLQVWPDS
jgi:hypothetical protein